MTAAQPVVDRIVAAMADVDGAWIEPPIISRSGPFIDLSGEEVRSRLVALEEGGLCLRPDLTIPVALAVLEAFKAGPGAPTAYRYDAPAYRYASRAERVPIEIRMVGQERYADADPVAAEAETLATALSCVAAGAPASRTQHKNFRAGVRVRLGDAGALSCLVDALDLPPAVAEPIRRGLVGHVHDQAGAASKDGASETGLSALAEALSGLSPERAAQAVRDMYALAGVEAVGGRPPEAVAARVIEQAAQARVAQVSPGAVELIGRFQRVRGPVRGALDEALKIARDAGGDLDRWRADWETRLTLVEARGHDLSDATFDAGMVSRFDYYDGPVFGVAGEGGQALASGGRYDGLLARLKPGASTRAVGFAVRPNAIARMVAGGAS